MFRYFYRMPLFFVVVMIGCTTEAFSMSHSITLNSPFNYMTHIALFYVCSGITGIIFGVLIYALVRQRKFSKIHFHQHLGLEILWTTIPFLIVIVLAIPAMIELIHR